MVHRRPAPVRSFSQLFTGFYHRDKVLSLSRPVRSPSGLRADPVTRAASFVDMSTSYLVWALNPGVGRPLNCFSLLLRP